MMHLWPLLLPIAALSGWWVATRNHSKTVARSSTRLTREYIVGLNYLLNEQTDKAADIFINLLDMGAETVEAHLALGSFFRRRGEVDRAIHIHQSLIERPQLSTIDKKEALMALGQDYISAGVLDRAECVFREVAEMGGTQDLRSLHGLLAIYEREKAWQSALEVIQQMQSFKGLSLYIQAAHYHCELAELAYRGGAFEQAQHAVNQALVMDKLSVRASLLQATLNREQAQYPQAIAALKKVLDQDSDFFIEIIKPLVFCYRALDKMDECIDFLQQTMETKPTASAIFVLGEYLREHRGGDEAIDFVSDKLGLYPSIKGLNRLIFWHLESAEGKVKKKLHMLYNITSKFLENKPIYRCNHCGFGSKYLHWNCPSCKQWGKIKPIHGLEGD